MAQRKTLSEDQVALLRWVSDGCPEGVMVDLSYRVSAAALNRRGLLEVAGSGESWSAKITEKGLGYLAEVDGPNPPVPRQGNVSVTQQLVDDVVRAGGTLAVPERNLRDPESVDYEKRARLAEAYGKVPDGKWLISVRTTEGVELRLVDATEDASESPGLSSIEIPEKVGRYHKVARRYRDGKDRHEVSRAQMTRAVKVIHVLAIECEKRGWTVSPARAKTDEYGESAWKGATHGNLQIEAEGHEYALRIVEEGVHPQGAWNKDVERYRYSSYWPGRGEKPEGRYDAKASGVLKLELIDGNQHNHAGRQSSWADRQSWTLEHRLPHVFREIEVRIVESERIAEQQKVEAEARAEEERLAREERKRVWNTHMENARKGLLEATRAETLREQSQSWHEAEKLRSYCAEVRSKYGDRPNTQEWLVWAERYIETIDPMSEAPVGPDDPEPNLDDLQEFMPDGWSAKDPELAYSPQRGHHVPFRGW